jgi:LuxR family transcriptional regulator, maltose regulon positive regulatory protein
VGDAYRPATVAPGGGDRGRAGGVLRRPDLVERLLATRVTVVSAPAGSGKTVLLRSWTGLDGVAGRVGWVPSEREKRDPQRFWLSVLRALRQTDAGAVLVQALSAAPDLDGWAIVERLLTDLAPLRDRLWLAIDDVHELGPEVLRQLELLMMRAPAELRFVLATRQDVSLGLHRLRLEEELTEIRAADLTFTLAEARELLEMSGVLLPGSTLAKLHERTEGWAAGLRLAALSLAGHPDPERFAAEFSGSERTVAEYLLAEVLDRQSDQVRRLLLRTSVLERVNGELACLLTGDEGGERVLQDLEQANAFVVSLDAARGWFRYHQMFAGLLQLELRRTAAPAEIAGLHRAAANWFAGHAYPLPAIRHAQAARDWDLAARLLADHWPALHLDGQTAMVHELMAGFPAGLAAVHAELAAVAAADELDRGSLAAAERYLSLAERASVSGLEERRGQLRLLLGVVRLLLARQRGDLPAVTEEAQRLQALADIPDAPPALGKELRTLALISLGSAEYWAARFAEAELHLERGAALARQIGRPFLELTSLAYQAATEFNRSLPRSAERSRQAVELAERHGWADEPAAGPAYMMLGAVLAWQGRPEEAEPWVQRAERTIGAEADPAASLGVQHLRGVLELARGHDLRAMAAFKAAERLARQLAVPHLLATQSRALLLQTLVRLGDTTHAEYGLAELSAQDRERGEMRIAHAALHLAKKDPRAAAAALAPVLDRSAPLFRQSWLAGAFLLEAIARDALGDRTAAKRALERALDLAEPDSALLWFLLQPAPALLGHHARHRTSHASLITEIDSLLAARSSARPLPEPRAPLEPLSSTEVRVMRYLPTNLTGPEIARELSISRNTVKTHIRNVYAKLGAHTRAEAVTRARALGLLAPAPRTG